MNLRVSAALLASLTIAGVAGAAGEQNQNWSNWRGPQWNGSSNEKDLPVKFSRTEGVRWAAELPGPSAGTPIVWGANVFLSAADEKTQKLLALCIDRTTGKIRWQQDVGSGYRPGGKGTDISLDHRSNYASPSPVTDGQRTVFFYGNGDLVAVDNDGKRLWARNMQKEYGDFCFGWTFSSSPQLYEGKLYFQILQRDIPVEGRGKENSPSYLLALDPASGKELWRVERPTGAKMESREAFTTPIPFEHNGRKELLLAGGNLLTGHDPATGKELWRWGGYYADQNHPTMRLVPSPVAGGGVALACGPKREPVYAVKVGQTGEAPLAWSSEPRGAVTTDVPTPLYYNGKFYVLSDVRKSISCLDPADGKVLWTTPLAGPSMCWGSPTGADGKLYFLSLRGEAHVLDAATGEILNTSLMAQDQNEIRSSIAVSRGNLFIRTNTHLYCIGK